MVFIGKRRDKYLLLRRRALLLWEECDGTEIERDEARGNKTNEGIEGHKLKTKKNMKK